MLRRAIVPLVAFGLVLLLASVALVGRDLTFARHEAEEEVLALAEATARAIQFVPSAEIHSYLAGLIEHPAVAAATVYSAGGARTMERRAPAVSWERVAALVPSLSEPIVACRAVGATTLCLEADRGYYRIRLAALAVPHSILLLGSALLLGAAMILAKGSSRREVQYLARTIEGAAAESNYAVRARETKGSTGPLARAINVLLEQMQQRDLILRRRTTELEAANREVEAFSYSVSHDLRSPLAGVDGFAAALEEFYADKLDDSGREYLKWIRDGVDQMKNLVAGLLEMSRVSRSQMNRTAVDLSALAESIADSLRKRSSTRVVDFRIEQGVIVDGDERLLHAVLENLMSNAYKFTGKIEHGVITVGSTFEGGRRTYFVRDNGAGFDSTQAAKMFTAFQRLHSTSEFEGTGIGLATVKRIIERHGGAIWADGQVGQGATFFFTLGEGGPANKADQGERSGVMIKR